MLKFYQFRLAMLNLKVFLNVDILLFHLHQTVTAQIETKKKQNEI